MSQELKNLDKIGKFFFEMQDFFSKNGTRVVGKGPEKGESPELKCGWK